MTDRVQCTQEVNPLKIGKYIPGCRLPTEDEAKAVPLDACLLLAWHFLKEILPKKHYCIMSGGKFIVLDPETGGDQQRQQRAMRKVSGGY